MADEMKNLLSYQKDEFNEFSKIENLNYAIDFFYTMKERFEEKCKEYDIDGYFERLKDDINDAFLRLDTETLTDIKIETEANYNYRKELINNITVFCKFGELTEDLPIEIENLSQLSYTAGDLFKAINKYIGKNYDFYERIGELVEIMPTRMDIINIDQENLGEALSYAYESPGYDDFIQKFPGAIEKLEKMSMASATDIDSEKKVIPSIRANPYMYFRYGRDIMTIQ